MLSQLAVGYRFFKMWTSAINACSHMSIPQETKQPSKPLSILDYDLTQYALYVAIDQAECKLDLSVGVKARRESKVAISSNLILSVHNLSFTQTFDSLLSLFSTHSQTASAATSSISSTTAARSSTASWTFKTSSCRSATKTSAMISPIGAKIGAETSE